MNHGGRKPTKMITLNTTIWEEDFDQVLDEKSWFLNFQHPIVTEKTLVINNIENRSKSRLLEKIARATQNQKINIVFVDDAKKEAKKFFNLKIDESTLGYYYTIQYFVSILKCTQPYIFNVSADCDVYFEEDYLKDSIEVLRNNIKAITTTLPWSTDPFVGINEQDAMFKMFKEEKTTLDNFYYSCGFSDQVFIGDIGKLKNIDYTLIHPSATQFPAYGGDCFEKRLCSYFLREHAYRLIYKKYHYVHNIPKPKMIVERLLHKIRKYLKKLHI